MKILFDTNIILDVLLDRKPFVDIAAKLLSLVEKKEIDGFLGATTITTIFYLAAKVTDKNRAKTAVGKLLSLFEIAPITQLVLKEAINLQFVDFEDAVLHEAARQVEVQGIVTRNPKDFNKASISIYTPDELYKMLVSIKPVISRTL